MPPKKTTVTPPSSKRTTTPVVAAPKATKTGRAKTSVVRTVAPMIPLANALVGGAMLPGGRPTPPAPGAPPSASVIQQPGKFFPVCTMPFNGVRNPASDEHCGILGGSPDPAKQGESTAKNNFCAPTHDPDILTYQKLLDLQAQSTNIPKALVDRKEVENLGEGNYVSYVAVIKNAHYSDTTGGEAVNATCQAIPLTTFT